MNPTSIEAYRSRLLAERAALEAEEAETQADRKPVELDQQSVGRLSRMDALQVQAMASAQSRRRAARRAQIAAALRRIEEDEFGWCQSCGEAVDARRLDFDPAVALCLACVRER
ncbi:MAG: TraR/DksA C4-type zinc finger protein [Pseudomonadota bacterium]